MKTSDKWQKEDTNHLVMDPDGWDRQNFQFSWYEELISYDEYLDRKVSSTLRSK